LERIVGRNLRVGAGDGRGGGGAGRSSFCFRVLRKCRRPKKTGGHEAARRQHPDLSHLHPPLLRAEPHWIFCTAASGSLPRGLSKGTRRRCWPIVIAPTLIAGGIRQPPPIGKV